METILQSVADIVRDNGLVGVVIVALGYGWYRLANLYHEAQSARIEDGKDAVRALEQNTTALNQLIDTVRNRREHN
jgi:ribose 5-phosphate isomerase RpiB